MPEDISISIDGPTASGKTTLAVRIAARLGASFLDTGLTFRAVAYLSNTRNIKADHNWQESLRHSPSIYHESDVGNGSSRPGGVYVDGQDVSEEIFNKEHDADLKLVAQDPLWRKEILAFHERLVSTMKNRIVVGRDVATTLLPDAALKVALTASWPVRRERRRAQYLDMPSRSTAVGQETTLDVEMRRLIGGTTSALVLDTTYLPRSAVVSAVLHRLMQQR